MDISRMLEILIQELQEQAQELRKARLSAEEEGDKDNEE